MALIENGHCEHCGKYKELYALNVIRQDGQKDMVHFCYNCYFKCKESNDWFSVGEKGAVKTDRGAAPVQHQTEAKNLETPFNVRTGMGEGKSFWTSFAKILNYIMIVISAIFGAVIAGAIDEEMIIVGAVIGLIIGLIVASLSMMIIEMSQNLKMLYENSNKLLYEIKKNNDQQTDR